MLQIDQHGGVVSVKSLGTGNVKNVVFFGLNLIL